MSAPESEHAAPALVPAGRPKTRGAARLLGVWTFRLALLAALYALGPVYDGRFVLSFLIDAAIFGLAALGLQHMVGDAGVLNLGQAAFFGLGAYGGVWTVQHWQWTTLPAFAAAIAVAVAGALLMAPLLRLRGIYFVMASFAFGAMMFEAYGQLVSVTGGENGLFLIPSPRVLGYEIRSARDTWFLVLTVVVLCYAVFAAVARSGYGLSLHAVRQSERGARAAGINVARMHVYAVCLGVVPAALAGVLYAQVHGIVQSTNFDYDQSVTLITMVILGGVLSRWGAFAGALMVNYLAIYGQFLKEYRLLVYGLIIAVLMIVLPGGLAELARLLGRLARGAAPWGRERRAAA